MAMQEFKFINLDTVASTNEYAMKYAEDTKLSCKDAYVITAREQTKGKGRRGRSFESTRDKGIFASILLKPEKKAHQVANVTLVAALALARALDKIISDKVSIKWPNDIILNGRKLCGILTELKNEGKNIKSLVIGIGVNVNNESFSSELEDKATSLFLEYNKKFDKELVLEGIVEEFKKLYHRFLKENDLSFMLEEYNSRLINRNSTILVEYKNEKKEAIQLGVDADGVLKVLIDGEEKSIVSGEIQIRGVLGYV